MRTSLRTLWKNDRAAVAPTVALTMIGLVAAGGLAFDYARLAALDTELQNAADQAALAAATQLDSKEGSMERAIAAAQELVTNDSRFANDGEDAAVTMDPDAFVFYSSKPNAETETDGFTDTARYAEAKFIRLRVTPREAFYTLTPIVDLIRSGDVGAEAVAGLGTSICKVPPLMVCNPTPDVEVDWDAMAGRGLRAVAASWTPGGFGYLGPNDTPSTQEGLAYQNPSFECQSVDTGDVNTGNPQPAINAINTRFDIYEGGGVLSSCQSATCPAALNVTKDLVRSRPPNGNPNNNCRIHGNGWQLPAAAGRFSPRAKLAGDGPMTPVDANGVIDAMGLPRDSCHYTSYGYSCPGGRFGDGNWARGDYFNKYHSGVIPANASTMTRYQTYLWEIAQSRIPQSLASGSLWQEGAPKCNLAVPDPTRDRRVLQVAIGENCDEQRGTSGTLEISDWVDMFLVEPGVPSGASGRGNGDSGNEIYLEVIGRTLTAGSTATAQVVRRDVPYLVK